MPLADRTTLNNLVPNLDIGDVADPALRLAAFQYLYSLSDENYAYVQSLVTSGTLSPLPPDFMSRQAIINGNIDVWQRGTSFTSNSTYTADRWFSGRDGSGGFTNVSQVPFTVGQSEVPGEPTYYLRKECTVAPTGQTFNVLLQKIESVRSFAGKTVTLSFYGKMDAIRNGTIIVVQNFGSGGSSSVNAAVESVAYSATFQGLSITFTLPSILGKTIGTNDCLEIQFHSPLNAAFSHDIAQVQLCAGDTALPFQPRSFSDELALCQRYFEKSYNLNDAPGFSTISGGKTFESNGVANMALPPLNFMVRKRVSPTCTIYSTTGAAGKVRDTAASVDYSVTLDTTGETGFGYFISGSSGSAGNDIRYHYTADAEL